MGVGRGADSGATSHPNFVGDLALEHVHGTIDTDAQCPMWMFQLVST